MMMKLFVALLFFSQAFLSWQPNPEDPFSTMSERPLGYLQLDPETSMPLPEYSRRKGYPAEVHEVETEDGYILSLFRIQSKGQTEFLPKPVVLMWHPLFCVSDIYVINSEHRSPGYVLANSGYDVWFANARGTRYSLKHKTKNPDVDDDYWKFTWEEHAAYDLPAVMGYIANYTGKKVSYMGHSQASLIMVAALAMQDPIVEQHVDKIILSGPGVYISQGYVPVITWLVKEYAQRIFEFTGAKNFLTYSETWNPLIGKICTHFQSVCKAMMYFCSPNEADLDDDDIWHKVVGHLPSGTSVMNVLHHGQMLTLKEPKLPRFDYGKDTNLKVYGQETPPALNLTNIRKKVHLLFGRHDSIISEVNSQQLFKDIPMAEYKMYDLGHCSFLYAKNFTFFDDILNILRA